MENDYIFMPDISFLNSTDTPRYAEIVRACAEETSYEFDKFFKGEQ